MEKKINIQMLGIDYKTASLDERALFSFTKKNMQQAMENIKQNSGILGVVILSTCNRMEIWVSTNEKFQDNLYEILCEIKGIEGEKYQHLFRKRRGKEAVKHVFSLSAGLKSQILGEDQILTQVKDALTFARENYCTDQVLEVLFRKAITAAKKVKTEVILSKANHSVIHRAVEVLKEKGITLEGKTCMVIGNGEMGRLTAEVLMEQGADVTVTVRQYRSGVVNIPKDCKRINYGERTEFLKKCQIVISATASPNFTIIPEMLQNLPTGKELLLIDLAVPRDIHPQVAEIPGITLYHIDSFQAESIDPVQQKEIKQAKEILRVYKKEFYDWYEGRELIPIIEEIKKNIADDASLRLTKAMKKPSLEQKEKEKLILEIHQAMEKTMGKLLFELKDQISEEAYLECIGAMEKIFVS